MPHAAAMHTSDRDLVEWTASDWTIHMDEEEAPGKLFDVLRAVGADPAEVDELERDHAYYRPLLKNQSGPAVELPRGDMEHSIDAHGALEDALIVEFAPRILSFTFFKCGTVAKVGGSPFGDAGSYAAAIEDYSGQLKDAGEQAKAQSEAQGKKDFRKYAAALGAGDYADAVYDFGVKLSNLIYGSEYDRANSDDQKKRLTSDVARIVGMGYPPAGLVSYADFGARDVADRIEQEFSVMDAVDAAKKEDVSKQIGDAAIYTAAKGASDPAGQKVLSIFKTFSNPVASSIGTMWFPAGAPTYLVDKVPMKPGDRPEIDYVAAAASGLYGAPLDDAQKTAYLALNTYASRRGLSSRNDFLGYGPYSKGVAELSARYGGSVDDVSHWLNINAAGDAMADAWIALRQRYDCRYRKAGCSSWTATKVVGAGVVLTVLYFLARGIFA